MTSRLFGAALAVVAMAGTLASAGTLKFENNNTARHTGGWGTYTHPNVNGGASTGLGGGGAFFVTATNIKYISNPGGPNAIENGTFQTFCIELNQNISFGSTYNAVVNPAGAVNGGNGNSNPDPLDASTKWLYWNFRQGTLASALSGGTLTAWNALSTVNRNAAIQYAIWFMENELVTFNLGSNYSNATNRTNITTLVNGLVSTSQSATPVVGQGRVVAINVGTNNQDMLGIVIPLPSAGGLGLAGLLGVMAIRRRVRI